MDYRNSEFQHLLLQNEVYLRALQRSSVPVYSLGFEDFTLEGSKSSIGSKSVDSLPRYRKGPGKVLRAVVPTDSQVFFMDHIEETMKAIELKQQEDEKIRKKKKQKSLKNSSKRPFSASSKSPVAGGGGGGVEVPILLKQEKQTPTYRPLSPTIAKLPSFGRPTQRMIEEMEEAKKLVEQREKEEMKKKLLYRKLSISQNGREYVYDYSGYRIPLDDYENYKKQYHEEFLKKQRDKDEKQLDILHEIYQQYHNENIKFTGKIVEKTSKYVENLRHQTEQERGTAAKSHQPESTLAMEEGEKVLPISLFQQYPEFLLLEKDDVMVTIEHCHNCESHNWANHHIEEQYINTASDIQDTLQIFMKDFPIRFFCIVKPIPDIAQVRLERSRSICQLPNASPQLLHNPPPGALPISLQAMLPQNALTSTSSSFVGQESRVGAMEVQIMIHTGKERISHILHSKLVSGNWPKVPILLSQIEMLFQRYKYPRMKGTPQTARRKSSLMIDGNNNNHHSVFQQLRTKRRSGILTPEMQIARLKKEIHLVPSFDFRQLKKSEVTDFFVKSPARSPAVSQGSSSNKEDHNHNHNHTDMNSNIGSLLHPDDPLARISPVSGITLEPIQERTVEASPVTKVEEAQKVIIVEEEKQPEPIIESEKHHHRVPPVSPTLVLRSISPISSSPFPPSSGREEKKIEADDKPITNTEQKEKVKTPSPSPSHSKPNSSRRESVSLSKIIENLVSENSIKGIEESKKIDKVMEVTAASNMFHSIPPVVLPPVQISEQQPPNSDRKPPAPTSDVSVHSNNENKVAAVPPTPGGDDYTEYDDFEPISTAASPEKPLEKKSSGSLGAYVPSPTGALSGHHTPMRKVSSEHFDHAKQAVLDLQQMLLDDEYEDEFDNEFDKTPLKKGDTQYWGKDFDQVLGIDEDES